MAAARVALPAALRAGMQRKELQHGQRWTRRPTQFLVISGAAVCVEGEESRTHEMLHAEWRTTPIFEEGTNFLERVVDLGRLSATVTLVTPTAFLATAAMFKHVTKQAPSDESSSDGSEHDPEEQLDGGDADFTGFGDEDAEMEEGDAEANAEAAFWGQADDETLPPNLPSLLDAKTAPIFELSADAKGRKTVSGPPAGSSSYARALQASRILTRLVLPPLLP